MLDANEKNQMKELSKEEMTNLQGGSLGHTCYAGMIGCVPPVPGKLGIQDNATYNSV